MFESIAIVGATGAVGSLIRQMLEERNFPYEKITFLASKRSAGKTITFKGEEHTVEELRPEAFDGIDLAIGSTPDDVANDFCPWAVERVRGRRRERLLADGSEGAAGHARGQSRGGRQAPGHHRQPELFDDADGRGDEAAARRRPHSPRRGQHLSGHQRRRASPAATTSIAGSRGVRWTAKTTSYQAFAHPIAFNLHSADRLAEARRATPRKK